MKDMKEYCIMAVKLWETKTERDFLQYKNEKLKRQLDSYRGSFCREKKAIYRANYLEDENEKLRLRIHNAIEYIKYNIKDDWSIVETSVVWKIEEILKGKK